MCAGARATSIPSTLALVEQILLDFGVVNILLAAFNMIPIPPLDGSALVERLLPGLGPARLLPDAHGFHGLVLLLVLFDQDACSQNPRRHRELVLQPGLLTSGEEFA